MFDIKDQIKFFGVQPRRLDRTIQLFGGALSGGLFMLFSAAVAISAFQLISGVCNYKSIERLRNVLRKQLEQQLHLLGFLRAKCTGSHEQKLVYLRIPVSSGFLENTNIKTF